MWEIEFQRALGLLSAHQYGEAASLFESLAQKGHRTADCLYNQAYCSEFNAQGVYRGPGVDFAQVQRLYKQALESGFGEKGDVYLNLGVMANYLARYEEAQQYAALAIAAKPWWYQAHGLLGMALTNMGKHRDAMPALERAVELNPDDHLALYNLGVCLARLGDGPRSLRSYELFVSKSPMFLAAFPGDLPLVLHARNEINRLRVTAIVDRRPVDESAYDVFISHASEDKDALARPLHNALAARGVRVWFDENTLQLGDSLRRKIDAGLARCRFGIVIVSRHFLAKEWPQRELDGLVARETASGEKAILPIWHEIDLGTVTRHSPVLADRLAARSDQGIPALVDQVLSVLER